jgi:hypothetical protein
MTTIKDLNLICIILFSLFMCDSLYAQSDYDVNFIQGKSFKTHYSLESFIIHETSSEYYHLTKKKSTAYLNIVDKDLNDVKKSSLNIPLSDYRKSIRMKGNTYIFSGVKEDEYKLVLKVSKFDENSKLFDAGKPSFTLENPKFKSKKPIFSYIEISENQEYMIGLTDITDGENGGAMAGFVVFDAALNEVWKNESFKITNLVGQDHAKTIKIGNDGTVYILSKIGKFVDSKYGMDLEIDQQDYKYELQILNQDEELNKNIGISINNEKITGINFTILDNGELEFFGTFLGESYTNIGVFNLIMNAEGEYDFVEQDLPYSMIDVFYDHTHEMKIDSIDFGYNVNQIIYNSDESVTVIAEQYYETLTHRYMNGIPYRLYFYGQILVMNFNQNGELKWSKVIPKMQYYNLQRPVGLEIMSYSYLNLPNGDIGLIYNGSYKNNDLQIGEFVDKLWAWRESYGFPQGLEKTDIVMCAISKEGEAKRAVVENSKNVSCRFTFGEMYISEDNELIFTGHLLKNKMLMKLEVTEF